MGFFFPCVHLTLEVLCRVTIVSRFGYIEKVFSNGIVYFQDSIVSILMMLTLCITMYRPKAYI